MDSPFIKFVLRRSLSSWTDWVPGNGKLINLWNDTVLGKIPPHLPRLQQRMDVLGLKTIWDIFMWENVEHQRWVGWNLPEFPANLDDEKS